MGNALTLTHSVLSGGTQADPPFVVDVPPPDLVQVEWAGVYASDSGKGTIRSFDVVTLEPGEQYHVTDGQPSPCAQQVVQRALEARRAAGWTLDPTEPILVVPTCQQDRHDFHLIIVAWWTRP